MYYWILKNVICKCWNSVGNPPGKGGGKGWERNKGFDKNKLRRFNKDKPR